MQTQMLIDGRWTDGAHPERIEVLDPATGDGIAEVAAGGPAEAVAACDAAAAAQPGWAAAAASQAATASAGVPAETSAMRSSVAGSSTLMRSESTPSRQRPSISI